MRRAPTGLASGPAPVGGAILAALLSVAGLAPVANADPAPDLTVPTAAIAAALDAGAARVLDSLATGRPDAGGTAPGRARRSSRDSIADRLDYLWVVRSTLTDPGRIERVVEHARQAGARGLLAQVVGRGDAYYRSDILPRAASLPTPDFDPLALLLARAHAAGLEVHAWVNCMLVWSEPGRPGDPRHVVNAHPDWVARLVDGRAMTGLSARQRRRLRVEGIFLSPTHPGVRAWLGSIVKEIAARYPVDGVHLDYIRLPGVKLADAPPAVAGETAPAPGEEGPLAAGPPAPRRARRAPARAWPREPCTALECSEVTAAVGEMRDSLAFARPGLTLSAAVVADTLAAERDNAQRWTAWLRDGLIDRAFAMCYAPPLRTVVAQLLIFAGALGTGGAVVPGIAVYNTSPSTAAAKIKAARALGFPVLALFSYDALAQRPGYWPRLRAGLGAPGAGRARPAGGPR
ncbi:MAG TPA: family 10 glycosylhydrolase [Candidatus Eisenbacteria bacterium]|jgi:uncharacterized lipoprotein YddW (UPF0748 family)